MLYYTITTLLSWHCPHFWHFSIISIFVSDWIRLCFSIISSERISPAIGQVSIILLTSSDVNKSIQRSLTKACARHGLGLYIYEGEDLPETVKKEKKEQDEEITLVEEDVI